MQNAGYHSNHRHKQDLLIFKKTSSWRRTHVWCSAVCEISAAYACIWPFSVWLDGAQIAVVLHMVLQSVMKGTRHGERQADSVSGCVNGWGSRVWFLLGMWWHDILCFQKCFRPPTTTPCKVSIWGNWCSILSLRSHHDYNPAYTNLWFIHLQMSRSKTAGEHLWSTTFFQAVYNSFSDVLALTDFHPTPNYNLNWVYPKSNYLIDVVCLMVKSSDVLCFFIVYK